MVVLDVVVVRCRRHGAACADYRLKTDFSQAAMEGAWRVNMVEGKCRTSK